MSGGNRDLVGTILRIIGIVLILITSLHVYAANVLSEAYPEITAAKSTSELGSVLERVATDLSPLLTGSVFLVIAGIVIFLVGCLLGPRCYTERWPKSARAILRTISAFVDVLFFIFIIIWFLGVLYESFGMEQFASAYQLSHQLSLATTIFMLSLAFFALGLLSRLIDAGLAMTHNLKIAAFILILGVILNAYGAFLVAKILYNLPAIDQSSEIIAEYLKNPTLISFEQIRDAIAYAFLVTSSILDSLNLFLLILPIYTILYGIGEFTLKRSLPAKIEEELKETETVSSEQSS